MLTTHNHYRIMAYRLKIEGNFLVVFEDGNPSIEYINNVVGATVFRADADDVVRFYWLKADKDGSLNEYLLGGSDSEFDADTLIDDRTGLPFSSIQELKKLLRKKLLFFFTQAEINYAQRIDEKTTAKTVYIGKAEIGALPSSAVWQIKRISDVTTTTITTWADGNDEFDNVWDDRAILTYS